MVPASEGGSVAVGNAAWATGNRAIAMVVFVLLKAI